MGLASWLAAHGADAQEQGLVTNLSGEWARALDARGDDGGHEGVAHPHDPDLVREGVFARWTDAIAPGARPYVDGAADLDGDGGVDRLVTVAPSADPYPFDETAGLVLVRSERGGFRAIVLCRDGFPRGEMSWRIERVGGRPLVTLVTRWGAGHASEGFSTTEERARFRLLRDGVLRHVGSCRRTWSDDDPRHPWSEGHCP